MFALTDIVICIVINVSYSFSWSLNAIQTNDAYKPSLHIPFLNDNRLKKPFIGLLIPLHTDHIPNTRRHTPFAESIC